MYRFLGAEQPVRERRNQLSHPHYAKPELLATAPNQFWSWDITRLLGPKRWTYYYVHHGRAQRVLEQRQRTLQDAWAHNPERFVHGPPKSQALPKAVWINPPTEAKTSPDAH